MESRSSRGGKRSSSSWRWRNIFGYLVPAAILYVLLSAQGSWMKRLRRSPRSPMLNHRCASEPLCTMSASDYKSCHKMLKEKGEPNEYACVEVTISCEEIRKNEADGCHGSIVVPLFARRQTTDSSVLKSIFFEEKSLPNCRFNQ